MEPGSEYSCGIVPVRYSNGQLEVLLGKAPSGDYFILPKGHIEEGESHIQTAVRELMEETGHEAVQFLNSNGEWTADMDQAFELPAITYWLRRVNRHKFVYFFIAQVQYAQEIRDKREILYVQWFPLDPNLHDHIKRKQVKSLYKDHVYPLLSSLS